MNFYTENKLMLIVAALLFVAIIVFALNVGIRDTQPSVTLTASPHTSVADFDSGKPIPVKATRTPPKQPAANIPAKTDMPVPVASQTQPAIASTSGTNTPVPPTPETQLATQATSEANTLPLPTSKQPTAAPASANASSDSKDQLTKVAPPENAPPPAVPKNQPTETPPPGNGEPSTP